MFNVTPHTSISIQYACISWMPKFHFMYNISFPCILHKIEDFPSCFGTRFCAVPLWRKSRSWTLTYKLETVFLAAGFLSKLQCNLRVPSASRAPTRGSNSSVQFHCCGAKWDVELWHISWRRISRQPPFSLVERGASWWSTPFFPQFLT